MRMSLSDQTRFPKSTRYIKNVLPSVIEIASIRRAFARFGELNHRELRAALRWGTDPLITSITGISACAQFSSATPDRITLNERIFTEFEAGSGRLRSDYGNVPALGVNVLHEMCHWGDLRDGVQQTEASGALFEEGQAFEIMVYGRDMGC